ncbi:hypothetical protein I3843_07G058200 [Carya illinoinensis]|nr:hypothetical protein I3843_07G058200 [Carya illinoinensis]
MPHLLSQIDMNNSSCNSQMWTIDKTKRFIGRKITEPQVKSKSSEGSEIPSSMNSPLPSGPLPLSSPSPSPVQLHPLRWFQVLFYSIFPYRWERFFRLQEMVF